MADMIGIFFRHINHSRIRPVKHSNVLFQLVERCVWQSAFEREISGSLNNDARLKDDARLN